MKKKVTHIHIHAEEGADLAHVCQLLQSVLRNITMVVTAQTLFEELLRQGFCPVLDESGDESFVWVVDPHVGMLKIFCPDQGNTLH